MALTKIAFFGDVVLSLLPIGALPVVPPIEIPLPFILVNAHTPKYMYVPPTSPASSFDLPSSSYLLSSSNRIPVAQHLALASTRASRDAPFVILIKEDDTEDATEEDSCVESSQGYSSGTSWSYLGVGLALILLLLSRSSIGIVNCSI